MKRESSNRMNGRRVTVLIPETPEDHAEIGRFAAADEIDVNANLGDQPEAHCRLGRFVKLAQQMLARWHGNARGENG